MSELETAEILLELEDAGANGEVRLREFTIRQGEFWGVLGGNGSGKTTFAKMLKGGNRRECSSRLKHVVAVSFEEEQKLLEREIYEDDSEAMDRIDPGRTVDELIREHHDQRVNLDEVIEKLQLVAFLQTGFRLLSTGERRRMMIARALAQAPEMIVLDEPYDGLDAAFTEHLKKVIDELSSSLPMVLIVNRVSDLSERVSHIALLEDMRMVVSGTRVEVEQSPAWSEFVNAQDDAKPLPSAPSDTVPFSPTPGEAIIEMRSVCVGYHGKPIICDLDWKVMPNEHWQVSGPNGCGKTTLVNLISGDHPQCYSNEIYIFGKKRGMGESIWEIKRHMGLMSTALQQQYRVSVKVETVLISGFFDSIGVYREVSPAQKQIAREWLNFLAMENLAGRQFRQLSFGQQRMLLIARALIKRPHLLILDEPCQGLDPKNRALVLGLVEQITRLGIAQVIYISHEAEDRLDCLTHELKFTDREKLPDDSSAPPYEIVMCGLG